ncbi:MAG: hypothetical protein ACE5JT_00590 [Nitrosopumilaceae archaeon]
MSSGDRGLKTKQELLDEYEKDYLARLEEKEKEPEDLQNIILQFAKEVKVHETKDYIGICVVCTKRVDRGEMVYKNNHLFHPDCFDQHGDEYQATTNLMNEGKRAKVDLIYLKNLKVRISDQDSSKNPTSAPKKKSTKRKRPSRKKKRRVKSRRTKTKKRSKKKIKRRKAKKRKTSTKKRRILRKRHHGLRPKRRTARRKVRRKPSKKRKAKRRR